MALTYDQLMQATGSTAWQHLNDALKTNIEGIGTGDAFFSPVLFCLMEREFRAEPNKKKAILLWELFLQSNYGIQETNVMRPDPNKNKEWGDLVWLALALEANNGVPEKTVRQTLSAVNTIIQSYNSATQLGMYQRWKTSGQRKFNTLGGNVSSTMFQIYVKDVAKYYVNKVNGTSSMDIGAEKLFKLRKKLGELAKKASFKPERLGLS